MLLSNEAIVVARVEAMNDRGFDVHRSDQVEPRLRRIV